MELTTQLRSDAAALNLASEASRRAADAADSLESLDERVGPDDASTASKMLANSSEFWRGRWDEMDEEG